MGTYGRGGAVRLEQLQDIDFSTIQDGYVLSFDSATGMFEWVEGGGGGTGFVVVNTSIDVNPAVANTAYLCDATAGNITITLPNATVGNTDEFRIILKTDTHNVIITTVGGTQLINDKAIQEIHTVNGQLYLKCNGTGYDIITDSRAYYRIIEKTGSLNVDLSDSGYESGTIYHCEPGTGNTITFTIPDTATDCYGNFCKFLLDGEGTVIVKTLNSELINGQIEQVITTGGFEITCFGDHYGITQDSRPKVQNTSLALYSLSESSTVIDPAGGFYKATATTITDSRYNQATGTEISSVAITGNNIYLAGGITDPGTIQGVLPEGPINTWVNARKISGTANFNFYVQYYHRTVGGVETLIGTSTTSPTISSNISTQYIVTATLLQTTFISTDTLVRKVFLNKVGLGTNPVAGATLEGPTPTYSIVSIGAGSISHNILAGKQGGTLGEYYHLTLPQYGIINGSNYYQLGQPQPTDDSTQGYVIGSRWMDVMGLDEFVCIDDTPNMAIWKKTTVNEAPTQMIKISDFRGVPFVGYQGDFTISNDKTITSVRVETQGTHTGSPILVDIRKNQNTGATDSIFLSDTPLSIPIRSSSVNRARRANWATITTMAPHGLSAGDVVSITGLGGTGYNTNRATILTTPAIDIFTYASVGTDEVTIPDSGGVINCICKLKSLIDNGTLITRDKIIAVVTQVGSILPGQDLIIYCS